MVALEYPNTEHATCASSEFHKTSHTGKPATYTFPWYLSAPVLRSRLPERVQIRFNTEKYTHIFSYIKWVSFSLPQDIVELYSKVFPLIEPKWEGMGHLYPSPPPQEIKMGPEIFNMGCGSRCILCFIHSYPQLWSWIIQLGIVLSLLLYSMDTMVIFGMKYSHSGLESQNIHSVWLTGRLSKAFFVDMITRNITVEMVITIFDVSTIVIINKC